ncbi:MAG TPA: OmpH family outer membrane protein [Flavobacterium sp.]|nr:OmpH family outer membrane protein [Flavobacterium sp.]
MNKNILILLITFLISNSFYAQTRGVKIGYIDMEYILQNVPEYVEAKNQLEEKALKWKKEIEIKKAEIENLKEALKAEQVLLTKELIDERTEEIAFQEKELMEYQQRRFGAKGDLAVQKALLAQPVQDQVFNSVQDIAVAKKYDFIFDKSSDLTMLFTANRYDISDLVVRSITRASKRNQLTKKQLKEEEAADAKLDAEENPSLAERQKKLEERKAAREKLIEERKLATEEKKLAAKEKLDNLAQQREANKSGTNVVKTEGNTTEENTDVKTGTDNETTSSTSKTASSTQTDRETAAEERAKLLEERKKALEERKKKIIEERAAIKKAKEEKIESQKAATEEQKQTEIKTN